MRRLDGIIESTLPPHKNILWINKGLVKYFRNGKWVSIAGSEDLSGYIKEQGEKIDSLDKEVGEVKSTIEKIGYYAHPVILLEIGDSKEIKAFNLQQLKEVIDKFKTNLFQAVIDYGIGVCSFIPSSGGTAHVLTAMGVMVHYDITSDGAVTKAEETNIPNLIPQKGTTGQVLKKTEEGIAWQNDNNTTYGAATKENLGLIKAGINIANIRDDANLETVIGSLNSLLGQLRASGVLIS